MGMIKYSFFLLAALFLAFVSLHSSVQSLAQFQLHFTGPILLSFWLGWGVAVGWKIGRTGRRLFRWLPLAVLSLLTLILFYRPIQWNVMDDEADIATTALVLRDMHLYGTVSGAVFPNPARTAIVAARVGPSKRPGTLASIVSLLGRVRWHPFLNAYVNAASVILLVFSFAQSGRQAGYSFAASAVGGWGVLLLPLTGLVFSSGGLEALYLVFILQSLVWLRAWLGQPDLLNTLGLTASTALLIHTRYEAVLWLPVLVFFGWRLRSLPTRQYSSWNAILMAGIGASLFLAIGNLRTHAILEQRAWAAQHIMGGTGASALFSLRRLLSNLSSLPDLYTSYSGSYPSDPWLTLTGLGAALWLWARRPQFQSWVLPLFGGCLVACIFLLLPYQWGQFQSSALWRLHAPVQIGLYIWTLLGLAQLKNAPYPPHLRFLRFVLPSILGLGLVLRPLSTSWKAFQTGAPEARALMLFLPAHPEALWVSSFPIRVAPFLVPVITVEQAKTLKRAFPTYTDFFAHWVREPDPASLNPAMSGEKAVPLFAPLDDKGHWSYFWDDPSTLGDYPLKKVADYPDAGVNCRLSIYQWMIQPR